MRRSSRKRKPAESLLDYEEFGELESEIKTEPTEIKFLDDESRIVPCCCLCKTSSEDNIAIFDSGTKHDIDIASKIQSCSGLEICSETNPDAHICRRCLLQLDVHYVFQKQARSCNEYAQNQITNAGEIRVCRFCSEIRNKLLDMYPGGESPENDLLQKIRECLAIEVNSRDPVTKICRNCIKGIDDLLEFRTRHLPVSACIKDETWHYGPSMSTKRIKQEDEDASTQDLYLNISDSESSSEENDYTDFTSAGRQKLATMRSELIHLISVEVDGKNFTVLSEDDEHMKVIFDAQQFRFYSERENGSSLWTCDQSKLRNCKMKLQIDAAGKYATLLAGVGCHTHPPGMAKLMQCPLGKGMAEMNGKAEPFFMYCSKESIKRSLTSYTRSLIIQGFRYYLHQIRGRGIKSTWYCVQRQVKQDCRARAICYGIFHKVEIYEKHNHRKLTQHDIKTLLWPAGIDTMSTDAISGFQNFNTIEKITEPRMTSAIEKSERARVEMKSFVKEKNPQIFRHLRQDAERNFEVIKTGATFKIVQDRYEYRYYGELSDKSSIWKCIMDDMRNCKLLAKITPDGKHLEIYRGIHSHGTEMAEIFRYPIGKRMIGEEPLWLLNRFSRYYESRWVIYRDYLFYIVNINQKGEVRWNCRKFQCRAILSTKGDFQEVVLKNEHSHEKPPKSKITKLLNESITPKVDVNNLSFKQQLLSHPTTKTKIWDEGENKYETLYILKDVKKGKPSGFIFRRHRFSFSSVDQNGTSKWVCLKLTDPERTARCRVAAIVEGLFESIVVARQHAHEVMPDSIIERLIKQYARLSNSSGEKVMNLEEIPDHKRPTGNILSILTRNDTERNFTMARAKTKLLVHYEGNDFRLKSRGPEGISTWSCIWLKIRKCPVSLHMSADGKQVTYLDPQTQHNHGDDQIGVFLQASGKGRIYDKDNGIFSSYWLFSYQCKFRSSRGIIYQGNKYNLDSIGKNGVSMWTCRSMCKVFVRVEGTFKAIIVKHEHNHARLTDAEIKGITRLEEVDKDLLPSCENSNAIVPTSDRPLRPYDILRIMSLGDPDRNFEIKIHKEEIKIIHEGYEFTYRSSTPSHTLWRCIFSNIHTCRVTLQIDNYCKQAFRPTLPTHTHFLKPSNLYDYPLGESKVMETGTGSYKPFWFLMQPLFIRPKLFIIYEDHRYRMALIAEKGNNSRWYCVGQKCYAKLTVKGLFESVVVGESLHTDPPLAQDKKSELIRLFGTSQPSPA